jgi:hypothetical protein
VTCCCAAAVPPAIVATANSTEAVTLPTFRIRLTILQPLASLGLLLAVTCPRVAAQESTRDDPFAAHRWHFETGLHAALETWNYNVSHEELYGLTEGITYGLKDGLQVTATQRVYYVSQRANDTWLLGLTFGFRGRVYRYGRVDVYLEGDVGISDAAIAAPPRGTRFNYVAIGSSGVIVRLRPGVLALAGLQWIHVSNNSLKGPGRNPDIEAIGPALGVAWRFR